MEICLNNYHYLANLGPISRAFLVLLLALGGNTDVKIANEDTLG